MATFLAGWYGGYSTAADHCAHIWSYSVRSISLVDIWLVFLDSTERGRQIDTGSLYRRLVGAQREPGEHISLWPGTICDPGRGSAGAGPVGKRHGHGYCHRRFRDGNVFYGGGQYSAISASNGLRWGNFHSGGV